jgi:hypothetical protein
VTIGTLALIAMKEAAGRPKDNGGDGASPALTSSTLPARELLRWLTKATAPRELVGALGAFFLED